METTDALVKRRLELFVQHVEDVPPLPQIAMKVLEMLESPSASATDLERVILSEQTLAMKILRMANSAFFGLPRSVASLRDAIVFLGFRKVSSIVVGLATFDLFGARRAEETDLFRARLWRHSMLCATCSRRLAESLPQGQPEQAFMVGLLHDIGETVLERYARDQYAEVIRLCEETDCPIIDAEVKVLGFNHAQLAGVLCENWGIPDMLTVPIQFHHNPMDAPEKARAAAQLCHVANGMAYGLCLEVTEEGPRYVPGADLTELPYTDECAVQALGLDMPRLLSLMQEAGRAALEQESLFRNAGGP